MDNTPTQSNTTEPKQVSPKIIIASIGVFALIAIILTNLPKKLTTPNTTPTTTLDQSKYKDGTYTAIGDYMSPGGAEQITVTLTIKDGQIIDSSVEPQAFRPISKIMQSDFAKNYKQFVVGKKISELKLDKVSGSSLTPKGFNDAIQKIKTQSQV